MLDHDRGRSIGVLFVGLLALLIPAIVHAGQSAPVGGGAVWLESEAGQVTGVKPNIAGWGRKEILSGGQWLHISVDADKVGAITDPAGVTIRHPFTVGAAGSYEVWDRIGMEFVRSPFRWRVDAGEWHEVLPDELTTDLMELDFWCEVAWLKLGSAGLQPGEHAIEIQLPVRKNAKGEPERILYASDALCISPTPFHPNGKWQPGQDWRTDDDRAAARTLFKLPVPAGQGARSSVAMNGLWEICRHDEQLPGEVAEPIKELPTDPIWTGVRVPGDKNDLRPDLLFCHRLWYRTRVEVPQQCAGQSFHILFPINCLNTTVVVNGVPCGFEKNPFCRFQVDITRAVKPGVNEVWVGIRDAWYGYSADPARPMKLRKVFNLPRKYFGDGFQPLAYPVWNASRSGILGTPEFVCAGAVKTEDVFVKPSVAHKRLEVEVEISNPSGSEASGEVTCEALESGGAVGLKIPATPFRLAAGTRRTLTVAAPWSRPKLWWPDSPELYTLRTTLTVGGKPVDVHLQTFGFREWSSKGDQFTLNGVAWPVWCDLIGAISGKEEWLARYRATNQRSMRLMGAAQGGISWQGMTTDEALDWFDRNGVVVRRCGPLDGEAIGYSAIEPDEEVRKKTGSEIKLDLMQNWRDQMVAQVKGERNHPSIMLWSTENEFLYINCINLYGGLMDQFEAEAAKTAQAVTAVDPTRLNMTDGGGAGKANFLPVHGDHYVFGDKGYWRYPQLAYEGNETGGGRGRWQWDHKRPRFMGEDYYATGINPAEYAIYGGEEAFQGKTAARPAAGIAYRFLAEGYRWAGQSAWQFWLGAEDMAGKPWVANAPRAVFCKEWDWTFASGSRVPRTLRIFNNTEHADPITFRWTLTIAGKITASSTSVVTVPPGTSIPAPLTLTMPVVGIRAEGTLKLELLQQVRQLFVDTKAVSVLPPAHVGAIPGLLVYDPSGAAQAFLGARGVRYGLVKSLSALPPSGRVLLIGKDALAARDSGSSALAAWAVEGRRIVVLEQKNPLRYQALPAEMEPDTAQGSIAFIEDTTHPALAGLKQKDFFTWTGDGRVYRDAYLKPTRGAKSLVQCHERLRNSALVEVPVGKGLILLCQLRVGEKLAASATAQSLLANLLRHASTYAESYRPVALFPTTDKALGAAINSIGLHHSTANSPLDAITRPGVKLAAIEATRFNLKVLAEHLDAVRSFTKAGGYIMLLGLAPGGLQDFNTLVGFQHMIRPFTREKVQRAAKWHPLTAGLTAGDLVMLSGERIFGWTADEFVVDDEFGYVVDLDDVAPFMSFPNDFAKLMVNGFRNADAWRYIVNLPLKEADWHLTLPKPQTIVQAVWSPNMNYNYATKVEFTFDGKEVRTFQLKPNNEPQTLDFRPPATGREVRVRIVEVERNPSHNGDVTGLDNLVLRAQRPPDFAERVRPMLNIGALVDYPNGAGGIVLCNVKFNETEPVPANAVKKRTILATILRNLRAPFVGGQTIVAGSKLTYTPLDILKQATQYRDDRGWFGDKTTTFRDMPTGNNVFAGVPFNIASFATSPVPTVAMLGGPGIPNSPPDRITGIPVGRKADALFFLHTARIDNRRDERARREGERRELARYVIHFADGRVYETPVYSEIDVEDYRQAAPAAIPGAQLAWTRKFENSELSAAAYSMQWNNPRPDVAIESIDLVYGKDRVGVPCLLAVTAAARR